jgi:exopolysaccharide biosynthesis polyprenyl glycosylphosphotransferase
MQEDIVRSARSLTEQNRTGERTRTVLADVVGLAPRFGKRQAALLEATERETTYRAARLQPRRAPGSPGRRGTKVVLILADVGAVILSMAVAGSWTFAAWVYAGGVLVSLAVSGAYRPRIALQLLNEAPALFQRLAVPAVLLVPLGLTGLDRAVYVQVLVTTGSLGLARMLAYAAIRRLRTRGWLTETTVIVGAGGLGTTLARLMAEHPEHGLRPIGFVDNLPEASLLPLPYLGPVEGLEKALRDFDVHHVVVAYGRVRDADWVSILRTAIVNGVEVHIVPRFFDVGISPSGVVSDQVWGIPLCRVHPSALRRSAWRAKRLFDVACAGLGLLVSAPVIGLIAAAVRVNSPGPILYRQRRIGQDGREFELLKFRSMHVHHNGTTSWVATSTDQTTVGRWLRRTSVDELPQLWNVLRGDMSLVGPRPERPHFVDLFREDIPGYWDRHRVPSGLTGWSQVHGLRGDETSMHERARFDNLYIESWSLWLDIVILMRTVGTVLRSTIGLSDSRRKPT